MSYFGKKIESIDASVFVLESLVPLFHVFLSIMLNMDLKDQHEMDEFRQCIEVFLAKADLKKFVSI